MYLSLPVDKLWDYLVRDVISCCTTIHIMFCSYFLLKQTMHLWLYADDGAQGKGPL